MSPVRIVAVRHGESEANVAYRQAGDDPLVYERGDDEVTLTGVGRTQAAALGRLLAALPAAETPELVWCSPYLRARETWAVAQETWTVAQEIRGAGVLPLTVDERLRDREWGLLAPYNEAAIEQRFPDELARLRAEGEYRYRPPQGESFADVAARLRDLLTDLRARARGRRVLIVAHDSVVLVLRHVIAEAPDAELAGLAEFAPILNASVSTWHATDGRLTLLHYNTVHHLEP